MTDRFWGALSGSVFGATLPAPDIRHDGALASPFHVSALLAETTGIAGAAMAVLRGQTTDVVGVDGRLCSLWADTSCAPIGWTPPGAWDALSSLFRGADGWIRLHTNAAHHRAAALSVLGPLVDKPAVEAEIARHRVAELEDRIIAAGGAAAQMMAPEAWLEHPQGQAVAREPIVHWDTKPTPAPERLRRADFSGDRPLAGLRVLDLTRVLAGPVATRLLAGFGAEVLRIDPAHWLDTGLLQDTTVGKRCAGLDLRQADDRTRFDTLVRGADLLVHGYRHGALAGLAYGEETLSRLNPGLLEVSLNAYGWTGPWAGRRGFDSLVQVSTGIADVCRDGDDRPGKLPVQALDHASGYLMAACAVEALRRARDGSVTTARVSLARMAHLLQSAGRDAQAQAELRPAIDADFADNVEPSDWGDLRRLRPPVSVPGAPMRWDVPSGELRRHAAAWRDI